MKKYKFKLHFDVVHTNNLNQKISEKISLNHNKRFILGRSIKHAHIVINDPSASRQHIEIKLINNQVWIRDLNTKNGTFVNSKNIINTRLKLNDMITIGDHIIYIRRIERVLPTEHTTTQILNPFIDQTHGANDNTISKLIRKLTG